MLDLLEDLKVVIPEDIRRATGIISEADNTLADAKESAAEIVEQAHQEADTVLRRRKGRRKRSAPTRRLNLKSASASPKCIRKRLPAQAR